MFLEKQKKIFKKMRIHETSKTQHGCTEIQLLNTSEIILVIVKELIFVYCLTHVSRHDYRNTMETLQ